MLMRHYRWPEAVRGTPLGLYWLLRAIVGVDGDRAALSGSVVAEKGTEPAVMAASLILRGLLSAHREDGATGDRNLVPTVSVGVHGCDPDDQDRGESSGIVAWQACRRILSR